jgi:hypothetical protein
MAMKESYATLTKELMLLELLERKQNTIGYRGKNSVIRYASTSSSKDNTATYVDSIKDTHDTHAFASISTTRSRAWIVDSGASQYVILW